MGPGLRDRFTFVVSLFFSAGVANAQTPAPTIFAKPTALRPAAAAKPATPGTAPAPPNLAPPAQSEKTPAAEIANKTQQHALQGNWIVYWYGVNKSTIMNVAQASGNNGLTTFMGALATLDKEACSTVGTVIDSAKLQYQDGPATKTLSVSAYVIMRVQCKNSQIWIEAFGLPAGKVLMSGRATLIDLSGKRSYAPVALGR
jgi:hypothetical protein